MKSIRSMWFYCILVFSAAIILILISVLSQNQIQPRATSAEAVKQQEQSVFNQTIQQSLSQMSALNESLQKENTENQEKINKLTEEVQRLKFAEVNYELLISAVNHMENKEYKEAHAAAVQIDPEKLSDNGRKRLEQIISRLEKAGYEF